MILKGNSRFRKGMKVRSVFEPERVFVIDKSVLLGRVFHEKGTRRWYTTRELRPADKRSGRVSQEVRCRATTNDRNALYVRSQALEAMGIIGRQRTFTCAECGTRFERKSKARTLKAGEHPFCCDAHRTTHWKRKSQGQEESRRSEASDVLGIKISQKEGRQ